MKCPKIAYHHVSYIGLNVRVWYGQSAGGWGDRISRGVLDLGFSCKMSKIPLLTM